MSTTVAQGPKTKQVKVIHNGESKPFPFDKDMLVGTLREQALRVFGVVNGPHLFGLFGLDGTELADTQTLRAAKVKAGDELILRQSTVRGG